MKTGLLFCTLLVLSSVGNAQTAPSCDSVVAKVTFENTSGLTTERQINLKKLVIGLCFERDNPEVVSRAVYEQLLAWGFKHATVYDPDHAGEIRVLDKKTKPSPVAVVIDFRLSGLD